MFFGKDRLREVEEEIEKAKGSDPSPQPL
jgi:hypothetical protein